jgi:3-phenylpropionate/trans-cinnamate dioxygenase ferredoxin component
MIWSNNHSLLESKMYNYRELDTDEIEYVPVAQEQDIPNGERLFVEIDGIPVVIFNIAGQLFAIGDLCSHDNGPLGDGELEGHAIVCPRHGARFDVRNGKFLTMPAVEDIPAYPVRVVDGEVEIGLPLES